MNPFTPKQRTSGALFIAALSAASALIMMVLAEITQSNPIYQPQTTGEWVFEKIVWAMPYAFIAICFVSVVIGIRRLKKC
ncbi:MAG: hypothetical protein AAB787_02870 [Patescibacteria group bacterium]